MSLSILAKPERLPVDSLAPGFAQFAGSPPVPKECYSGCGASGFISSGSPAGLKES